MKYLFITGGVLSSLGKGITAASLAMLLENRGLVCAMLKLDPYLNVDPGTMNPFQHGEVYVTEDGAETDLDLGHYSRFTNAKISQSTNVTSGQIYDRVIKRERQGDYLGQTIQVIPHITDEIKSRIESLKGDIALIEIGGTVGDIESLPFLEAIRQFRLKRPQDCLNIHLTHVPYLEAAGELKTKPTQHSVQLLRSIGIIPDMIVTRSKKALPLEIKEKISLFCSVPVENVIDEPDVAKSIYEVPLSLKEHHLDETVCRLLKIDANPHSLKEWEAMIQRIKNPKGTVTIGLVGKYVEHQDAYKSVVEALIHGGISENLKVDILQIESSDLDLNKLKKCQGILVPGGFGERGFEGMVQAAAYCRKNKVPYFGICLGMHVLSVEFARELGLKKAHTTEIDKQSPDPVICLLSEQAQVTELGGTMRLGSYPCTLKPGSQVLSIYGKDLIQERHRHRYEFNSFYRSLFESNGMEITGVLEADQLPEIIEYKNHPWMIAVQFHPEFNSKPLSPHPLFRDFIKNAHHLNRTIWDDSLASTSV
ncbi:MAG: CTP synthase [Simkaniaceae bacterium]